jgi:hypothetical protein
VQICVKIVELSSEYDVMSLSVKPKTGKRPFAVAKYSLTPLKTVGGRVTFLAEDIHKCPSWDCDDNKPCSISRVSSRKRKTGSVSTLEILTCAAHSCTFTVYPYGDVPYGRQPLVPINSFGEARFPPLAVDEASGNNKTVDPVQQLRENLECRCPEIRIADRVNEPNQFLIGNVPTNSFRGGDIARDMIVQHYLELSEHHWLPSLFLGSVSMSFGIKWSINYRVKGDLQFRISGSEKCQRRHTKGFLNLFGVGRANMERVGERIANITAHKVTAFQIVDLARTVESVALAKRILEVLRPFIPSLSSYFQLLALGTEAGFWGRPCFARGGP